MSKSPCIYVPAVGRLFVAAALAAVAGPGCIDWRPPVILPPGYLPAQMPLLPPPVTQQNPLLVAGVDKEVLWNALVDVVDDYFKVDKEERVRQVGDVQTEGRLDTLPRPASTILEPWERDGVTPQEKWEATLQSIRKYATVRVVPADGGYLVDVAVFKELEDLPKPDVGFISRTDQLLRNDDSVHRLSTPVGGEEPTIGWIPQGRDVALEQQILHDLAERISNPPQRF